MDQLRQGRETREIAKSLFISTGTVKSHMDHIFDKLGVRSRAEAVARYAEIENAETDEIVRGLMMSTWSSTFVLLPLEGELRRGCGSIRLRRHCQNRLKGCYDRRVELGVNGLSKP